MSGDHFSSPPFSEKRKTEESADLQGGGGGGGEENQPREARTVQACERSVSPFLLCPGPISDAFLQLPLGEQLQLSFLLSITLNQMI